MEDDVDFAFLVFLTEKVTGCVKVEEIELLVGRE